MTCRVCGFRNLESRATCRRCGAPLTAAMDKTLGDDAADDTGLVLELDERDIEPRPAPRSEPATPPRPEPAAPPRPDPEAEALRARALTAGDRDPRHAAAREPAERPAPPPTGPDTHPGHTLDLDATPPGGPIGTRPLAPARPRPSPPADDTAAGIRRSPPAAPPAAPPVAAPPAAARPLAPRPLATPPAPARLVYAGFWVRLLAMVVDWTVILAVLVATSVAALLMLGGLGAAIDPAGAAEGMRELRGYFAAFELVFLAVYFAFFTWAAGGTPGKLVLRLKVVCVDGSPVTGGRAFLRFLGYGIELVPGMIIAGMMAAIVAVGSLVLQQPLLTAVLGAFATVLVFVGYIWAAFDPRKQAWHDKLAGTVVVQKGDDGAPRG